jgi:hypothetical protein
MTPNTTTIPEHKFLINQITYSLPCQSFEIDYAFTKQERLPIVTEFVIRLIYVCNTVLISQIQEYFGFSLKETEVLVQNLISERLVSFNFDDELELTEYAKSKFAESSDELPRFFRIENKTEFVSFNLVSFNPIDSMRTRSNALSINLLEKDEHISKSKYFAEKSFQSHFYKIAKANQQELPELYKIVNVVAKQRYNSALPLDFYLKLDEDFVDVVNSQSTEELIKSDDDIYRAIIETLSQRNVITISFNEQNQYLLEYIKTFKDKVINSKLNSKNILDLYSYVQDVYVNKFASYSGSTEAIIGNLYCKDREDTECNYKKILSYLSCYNKHSMNICWLAPDYSLYGRTSVFTDLIKNIKNHGINTDVQILFSIDHEQTKNVYSNTLNAFGYADRILNGQLEILLYAPYFVCVLFHYYYPSNFSSIPIPIGFISESPDKVEAARMLIFENLHNKKRYKGKLDNSNNKKNAFADDFNYLNYSPI